MQTQYAVIIVFFAWICPKLTKWKLIGLGDMNREELKMRKKISLLNDITLQLLYFPIALIWNEMTSLCNGYVAFEKSVCKYVIIKDV